MLVFLFLVMSPHVSTRVQLTSNIHVSLDDDLNNNIIITFTPNLFEKTAIELGALPSHSMMDVIWDMDGVLLDSEPIYLRVETAVVSQYGKDIVPILPKLLGRTAKVCANITVEQLHLPITPLDYLTQRNALLMEDMKSVQILPGIPETVKHLKHHGVKCAIATSSPRDLLQSKKHGKDDFFALFDSLVCGDDVKNGKPDPEIFLNAAKTIGADPANCVVFEDAPAGLRAARLAGMKTVALPNPHVDIQLYKDESPTFIVPSARILDFDLSLLGFPPLLKQRH